MVTEAGIMDEEAAELRLAILSALKVWQAQIHVTLAELVNS